MFGSTFANLGNLMQENAIIISEGDHLGKIFFKDLYEKLKLNIFEYTFEEHDKVVAYSLGIPFPCHSPISSIKFIRISGLTEAGPARSDVFPYGELWGLHSVLRGHWHRQSRKSSHQRSVAPCLKANFAGSC